MDYPDLHNKDFLQHVYILTQFQHRRQCLLCGRQRARVAAGTVDRSGLDGTLWLFCGGKLMFCQFSIQLQWSEIQNCFPCCCCCSLWVKAGCVRFTSRANFWGLSSMHKIFAKILQNGRGRHPTRNTHGCKKESCAKIIINFCRVYISFFRLSPLEVWIWVWGVWFGFGLIFKSV